MTYRHSDYRDHPSPRDLRYQEDDRRYERRDPYFNTHRHETADYRNGAESNDYHEHPNYRQTHQSQSYDQDIEYDYLHEDYAQTAGNETDPNFRSDTFSDSPHVEGIRISEADLRDVDQSKPFPKLGVSVAKIAAIAGFGAFAVMLYTTMQPDVTAYEIISMDEYQGEQRPAWTLDPQVLEECDSLSACFKKQLALSSEHVVTTPNIQEIPASTSVQLTTSVSDKTVSLPAQMRVSKQWSNIRETPSMSGSIVASIAIELEVEVLAKADNWYEIVTRDDRNIRGFMHKNTLK